MKRTTLFITLSGLLMLLFLGGCYPDKIDYVDEYDVSATLYDKEADFSAFETFTVIDTIVHLTEDGEDDPNFSRDHDDFIIGLLRENMLNMGYTEIESPDSMNIPDLMIFTEALSSDFYSYYWWGYWDWYPWGGMYPGYPGYPGYPVYPWYPTYITSYTTGTLMIEMADMASFDPEADPEVIFVWTGLIDGLLVKNSSNTQARLEKQINQLFEQSPYLQQ